MEIINKETASKELNSLMAEFDAEINEPSREYLIGLIQEGRLRFDQSTGEMVYTLAKPVRSEKTDEVLIPEIRLHEPNGAELERINRGVKGVVKDGATTMDMGDTVKKTINAVVALGSGHQASIAFAERIVNRDLRAISVLTGFFG